MKTHTRSRIRGHPRDPTNAINFTSISIKKRKELLLDAFTGKQLKALPQSQNPFAILVKKLQESLTRMDAFEVITVTQNTDGMSKHES